MRLIWYKKAHLLSIFFFIVLSKHSVADLIPTDSASHKLPEHWRSYWLDEPEFGTRMFVADTGKISAPVLLLVHGLGQNGLRDWLPIVPALEKEFRVVLMDLPGFANSPTPINRLSPERYANLLHFVKGRFSFKPVAIVGHSMGAAITLRYAHRYPKDINQIGLIDAAGILQRTAFVKHSATDRFSVAPESMTNPLLAYVAGLQDVSNHLIEKTLRLPDPTRLLSKNEYLWGKTFRKYPNINAALSLVEENFSAAIFEQEKPVFILWGQQDSIAPMRTAHLLSANLKNSALHVIDDAGHVPMASHPREVSEWLIANLQRRPSLQPKFLPSKNTSEKNYQCDNLAGAVLRGEYNRISINECSGVFLDGVIANELIVKDSVVELLDSHLLNPATALTVQRSVLLMTGGSIAGNSDLHASRIDFAGVTFANRAPFTIKTKSRLVLSVSRAGEDRYLHSDIQLKDTVY